MQAQRVQAQPDSSSFFQATNLEINEAAPGEIGAEIIGLDVRSLTSESPELAIIREVIYRNKVIALRGQHDLTTEEYVAFTRKLGRPQIYFQPQYHHPDFPEIFVSSNVLENGKKIGVSGTGKYWHTDCAFEKKPLSFTSVLPQVFPKAARMTHYIDMHKVYEALPEDLKQIVENASMVHEAQLRYKIQESDIDQSLRQLLDKMNEEVPPVVHPAVIQHPVTKEKILYMSRGFTTKKVGLDYEENQKVMKQLFDFIEKEEHVHTHYWEKGDLIIWDNRFLNHMSSNIPQGQASKMYRIGIYDDYPFYVGLEK